MICLSAVRGFLGGRWFRLNAMVAPFGVLASTALLVYLTEPEADGFREFVRVGRESVDLGAVVYAAAAVSAERGVAVIFWALEQRKKYIAERIAHNERVTALWREEGREKGRTEGRAEGRAEAGRSLCRDPRRDPSPGEPRFRGHHRPSDEGKRYRPNPSPERSRQPSAPAPGTPPPSPSTAGQCTRR